jgi:hypothetical protein
LLLRRAHSNGNWLFADTVRPFTEAGVVLHVDDLPINPAVGAQRLMRTALLDALDETVVVSDAPIDDIRDEQALTPISFSLYHNNLTFDVEFVLDEYEDELDHARLRSVLEPLMRGHRMHFVALCLAPVAQSVVPPYLWLVRLGFHVRGRVLGDLFQIGQQIINLLTALQGGDLARPATAGLVRGGAAEVLIGQPENHWLDVKGQHHDLATDHGEIALAQAVSRFCNAEQGGLVIVGMSAKRVPGGEEIRSLAPVPHDGRMARRYQQVLEKRLFPPPDVLTIEAVPEGDGMLVLIDIPPQPEELKPFLVHGAIVDGRVEGAFISIVRSEVSRRYRSRHR